MVQKHLDYISTRTSHPATGMSSSFRAASGSAQGNSFCSPTPQPSEPRRSSLRPSRSPARQLSRVRFEDLSDLESLEATEGGLYLPNEPNPEPRYSQMENDRVIYSPSYRAQRQSDSTLLDGGREPIAFITTEELEPEKISSASFASLPSPVADASEKRRRLRWLFNTRKLESTPSQLSAKEMEMIKQRERRGFISDFYDILELPRPVEEVQVPPPSHRKDSKTSANTSNRKDSAKTLVNTDNRKDSIKSLADSEVAAKPVALKLANKKDAATVANEKIVFHQCSLEDRHRFILALCFALLKFGAPSHRLENQLMSAVKKLEIQGEFVNLPSQIIYTFRDPVNETSEVFFVKCPGRISLGRLAEVHDIYREVTHDAMYAIRGAEELEELVNKPKEVYSNLLRCIFAFCLSALICPLSFGGSFIDLWFAGLGAFMLSCLQMRIASKNTAFSNVFEIMIALIISFGARGLSSIHGNLFCYSAITSSSIIGILPGYIILTSSLELSSKKIHSGSVRMVYAFMYTLFLGFGLRVGSEFYLVFDPWSRHKLVELAQEVSGTVIVVGSFAVDNSTMQHGHPAVGTYTFTDQNIQITEYIISGCYRGPNPAWYLSPAPWWAQFIIVPVFSLISSLANLQPVTGWENKRRLTIMVLISCASYTANTVANRHIFNRSDIVSAIGAFTVGLLGNIHSRGGKGTAFTSMVTGVLFLVPSGLSQSQGYTGQGGNVELGGAMISVAIGVTVGLLMSQAIVYSFGKKKTGGTMSF